MSRDEVGRARRPHIIIEQVYEETEDDKLTRPCLHGLVPGEIVQKIYCKSFSLGRGCKYYGECWNILEAQKEYKD